MQPAVPVDGFGKIGAVGGRCLLVLEQLLLLCRGQTRQIGRRLQILRTAVGVGEFPAPEAIAGDHGCHQLAQPFSLKTLQFVAIGMRRSAGRTLRHGFVTEGDRAAIPRSLTVEVTGARLCKARRTPKIRSPGTFVEDTANVQIRTSRNAFQTAQLSRTAAISLRAAESGGRTHRQALSRFGVVAIGMQFGATSPTRILKSLHGRRRSNHSRADRGQGPSAKTGELVACPPTPAKNCSVSVF